MPIDVMAEQLLIRGLRQCRVPDHMWDGLLAYILHGRPVGDFLDAVLTNDLREAWTNADAINQAALGTFVNFLYHYAPARCWGSITTVDEWRAHCGMEFQWPEKADAS